MSLRKRARWSTQKQKEGVDNVLSKIWVGFLVIACVGGALFGQMGAVSQAAAQGAGQAVGLLIEMIGLMMFWSGIMGAGFRFWIGAKNRACHAAPAAMYFWSCWTGFPKYGAGQLHLLQQIFWGFPTRLNNPLGPAGGYRLPR